jgi:lysozyme
MPLFGVDVSKHQGTAIDWGKVRASGIDFMIARASLATTPDGTYRDNVKRAKRAGMPVVGAYHFLYPADVVSAVKQARLFVERIENADGILTMLDIEKDTNRTTGRVFEATISETRAFAEEFAKLTDGHALLMYAPRWYWRGHIGDPPASDLGPLCASRYVPVSKNAEGKPIRMTPSEAYAKVPPAWWKASHGGWKKATVLQFTSTGKVNGHPGRIDLNAFQGDLQKLKLLTGPAGSSQASLVPPDSVGPAPTPSSPDPQPGTAKAFHKVISGETLSGIAARHGFQPTATQPAFRVMINMFPENAPFRANPNLIHPGERVRVR